MQGYDKGFVVDLETATGRDHPRSIRRSSRSRSRRSTMRSLPDRDRGQRATGDRGLALAELTGPLPQEMRDKMERTGLCMGCHQEMTERSLVEQSQSAGLGHQ